MNTKFIISSVIASVFLWSGVAMADDDKDADRESVKSSIEVFTRDAAITLKVKTRLAEQHITSLGRIHVDTDNNGDVWLSGSARTQEAATHAVQIARETEGVKSVVSEIVIKQDD